MNLKATATGLVIGIGILLGVFAWHNSTSVEKQHDQLVDSFMEILPSSLEYYHREEIEKLFDRFWYQAGREKAAQSDVDIIVANLKKFINKKTITIEELDYLMAEVGYFTFRSIPRLNLADGEVDHPVLNPSSAIVTVESDSAFNVGFDKWKASLPDSVRNRER